MLHSLLLLLFLLQRNEYGAKNVQKTAFDSTFEMIRIYPIRLKENNRKTFEGASMEQSVNWTERLEETVPYVL